MAYEDLVAQALGIAQQAGGVPRDSGPMAGTPQDAAQQQLAAQQAAGQPAAQPAAVAAQPSQWRRYAAQMPGYAKYAMIGAIGGQGGTAGTIAAAATSAALAYRAAKQKAAQQAARQAPAQPAWTGPTQAQAGLGGDAGGASEADETVWARGGRIKKAAGGVLQKPRMQRVHVPRISESLHPKAKAVEPMRVTPPAIEPFRSGDGRFAKGGLLRGAGSALRGKGYKGGC